MKRIYNFNAGPAMLPLEVLQEVQSELLVLQGSGMSILEMSHRAPIYEKINAEAEADIKELLGLGDDYCVLFMGGGASLQFSMVPMNFLGAGQTAAYAVTSNFSDKAVKEAEKVGKVVIPFSSKAEKYDRVPQPGEIRLPENCAYLHITANNTIEGTEYSVYPETGAVPLIADMSSDILSKPIPAEKFSLIYAGVQKNIGPAGVVIAIIREDLITDDVLPGTPTMLKWKTQADNDSLYNTPPCYNIYICGKVFKWLKKMGGLSVMKERNEEKAKILYDFLDQSRLFKGTVRKEDRSLMNVPFVTGNEELDAKFVKEAAAAGFVNLKGHRTVGGMRASIYNAMPKAGVEKLVEFMKKFEEENA